MKKIICFLLVCILTLSTFTISFADDTESGVVYVRLSDLGFSKTGTSWAPSSLRDDLLQTTQVASGTGESCEWRPTLSTGSYEVWVWKIYHENSAKKMEFKINSAEGESIVNLNYAEGTDGWVKLGTYSFDEGMNGYVTATGSDGYLRAGPMKFVPASSMGNESGGSFFTDIQESAYKNEINFLYKVGIINTEDNKYRPKENITNSEFVSMLDNIIGTSQIAAEKNSDNITYNNAVKDLLYMLGYEVQIEAARNKQMGLLMLAGNIELTKGIKYDTNAPLSREVAAKLLYNSLHVDVLEISSVGKYIEYKSVEGNTPLNIYMGIEKIEGQVCANYYTTLTGSSSLDENQIKIGNTIYDVGDTNASEYIGQSVVAYIKIDEECPIYKILHIEESKFNQVFKIDSEDISLKTNLNQYVYHDNSRLKSIKLEYNTVVIYNGLATIDYTVNELIPHDGDVTLIDSDKNGCADVVISNDYKTLVVDATDKYLKKIYFKYQTNPELKSISFEEKNTVKISLINPDGSKAGFNSISEWSIVSLAKSKNGEIIQARISHAKVRGGIEMMSDDEVTINSRNYSFIKDIALNLDGNELKLSYPGTFCLDYKGRIACADYADNNSKTYGFIKEIAPEGVISQKYLIRVYTEQNTWENLELADKVLFNGILVKSKDIYNSPLIVDNDGETIKQIISYCQNDIGKINILNCATQNNCDVKNSRVDEIRYNYEATEGCEIIGYGIKTLFSKYLVTEATRIFVLPADLEKEEDYDTITSADIYNGNVLNGVKLYDVSEDMVISTMSISEAETDLTSYISTTPVGVVEKVYYTRDKNNDYVLTLSILKNGGRVLLYEGDRSNMIELASSALSDPTADAKASNGILPEQIMLSDLKKGDVIQYVADKYGKIKSARVLFRINSPIEGEHDGTTKFSFNENFAYAAIYYSFSTVERITNLGILTNGITQSEPEVKNLRFHLKSGSVVRYLSDEDTTEYVQFTDISQGDKVFVFKAMGEVDLILIYK